jgi:hypothetical protein
MDWQTFFMGSVLGGLVAYLARSLFEHRLAKSLSFSNRKAEVAREFRAKVHEALALFQRPEENWNGNNRTADAMRNFVRVIDLAAKDFAEFLSGSSKTQFIEKWRETKEYCSATLARAMAERDVQVAQEAKGTFLKHVEELLSYAKT